MDREDDSKEQRTLRIIREARSSQVTVKIMSGPNQGKTFPVEDFGHVRIGSAEDNDIIIQDPTVSRHHAEIRRLRDAIVLKDLDSTNGTFLGEIRVQEAFLNPNTAIRLGRSQLSILGGEGAKSDEASSEFAVICSKNSRMIQVLEAVEKMARSPSTILVCGETGTGKELVARAIHSRSGRSPLVIVDCSAIPEQLMESELFGHEKGAFTGATGSRKGAFEEANGGSLLFDEIGELIPQLQPKLLRFLESHEVKRVGSARTTRVDVRVIAATNRNLKQECKEGRFREDLYYRLSVLEILVPPLRERKEDISFLLQHFLKLIDSSGKTFSRDAVQFLTDYHWPGNVRQLRNLVERAAVLCATPSIELDQLMPMLPVSYPQAKYRTLNEMEKRTIVEVLRECSGNKMAAVKKLGIAYSTLHAKIKKYGLAND